VFKARKLKRRYLVFEVNHSVLLVDTSSIGLPKEILPPEGRAETLPSLRFRSWSWAEKFLLHSGSAAAEKLIFASRNGTPLNPKNLLRRVLQPTCRKLNLPIISWHSFRHTHATLLGEVGESLRTAQAILGHSDLKTTLNIYTHAIPESQKRAVDKVAGLLFLSVPEFSAVTENGKPN
jgi:integrase